MIVCIFDNDKENKYQCFYECQNGEITIKVLKELYDDEYSSIGIHRFGKEKQEYSTKNITIFDQEAKRYFKIFDCTISGRSSFYGPIESSEAVTYTSGFYIESQRFDTILEVPINPKINSIKIFDEALSYVYGYPSFSKIENEESHTLIFDKKSPVITIPINKWNVKSINLLDTWTIKANRDDGFNLNAELIVYAEILLKNKIKLCDVFDYVREFELYMELLQTTKRNLKKVLIEINSNNYEINYASLLENNKNSKSSQTTVVGNVADYLLNCYTSLPIRKSNVSNRNIPYVLFNKHRSVEDSFLLFYRFVECYYKKGNYQDTYLSKSFIDAKEIYLKYFKEEDFDNVLQEIISLRNHYVHSGYYIHGERLAIKFKEDKNKNHSAKADFEWIYLRTKFLYYVAIDIIYRQKLGYEKYTYRKHF